ncbi:response regulator [Candidatus Pantoea soli]|uniref:DNA-binding response regulator n=1 Tax=Candidatus Pantoea soli TaxID=3098669 RepID=A0A518XJL7_9GAMM|nr:response regulator [Pantoea soli]QDY44388.1 DNA-binding response regulator [Pantoea soli]
MTHQQLTVLVAEDDPAITKIVTAYLEKDGFSVLTAENGEQALTMFSQHLPGFVILDINMPKKNGWEVLSAIKKVSDVPVLMLTALDTDIDKVFALRTGADDYVVKPFNPSELLARVHVILRRMNHYHLNDSLMVYKTKNIEVNVSEHQVFIGESMHDISGYLTTTEFRVLLHLIRFPKRVFTRRELMEACLPEGEVNDRTVDSHISKLRKKLDAAGLKFVPESIRGFGYRLGD